MPPMMPVIRPFSGGTPEAMAMPMQSGIATRKTTIDAVKSRPKVPPEKAFSMIYSAARAYSPSPASRRAWGSAIGMG